MIIVKSVGNMSMEKCELIDAEARNIFACFTSNVIKCAEGTKNYLNRTRMSCKCNAAEVFPVCGENED